MNKVYLKTIKMIIKENGCQGRNIKCENCPFLIANGWNGSRNCSEWDGAELIDECNNYLENN